MAIGTEYFWQKVDQLIEETAKRNALKMLKVTTTAKDVLDAVEVELGIQLTKTRRAAATEKIIHILYSVN